jgi:general L-amino acid transport system substrate-binding protein
MFKTMKHFCLFVFVLLCGSLNVLAQDVPATPTPLPPGTTLNSILARGQVSCGVNAELPGFGYLDPNTGLVSGFDVDFCRALAAAIFGDATAVTTPLYSGDDGLGALQIGDVDVLFHNVVWSLKNVRPGLEYGPVNFYNGQTIMVRIESNLDDWQELDGRTICVTANTTAETHLPTAMTSQGLTYQLLNLDTDEEARDALAEGRCDAQSADRVRLEVLRQSSSDPEGFLIWSGGDHLYTSEPFAPLYRYGDQQWASIVRWTVLGLIQAEQLGVSSETVSELAQAPDEGTPQYIARVGPAVAGLLNVSLGAPYSNLTLTPRFMESVIREVGNYGEIYSRNLLSGTGLLNLERDLNRLSRDGGLLFAPDWG